MHNFEDDLSHLLAPSDKRFIPIEEVAQEQLDNVASPQNPFEALIAKEAIISGKGAAEKLGKEMGWERWIEDQLYHQQGETAEEDDKQYWDAVGLMHSTFEEVESGDMSLENFIKRYRLPKKTKKEQIQRLFTTGKSYGKRGRENPGKHQKGGESIRGR